MANRCCCFPRYHHVLHLMLFERRVSFTQDQTSCSSHPFILAEVMGAEEQVGKEDREPKVKTKKKNKVELLPMQEYDSSSAFVLFCYLLFSMLIIVVVVVVAVVVCTGTACLLSVTR